MTLLANLQISYDSNLMTLARPMMEKVNRTVFYICLVVLLHVNFKHVQPLLRFNGFHFNFHCSFYASKSTK